MKRVLIVSPHFPPINAADCHRARMAVAELPPCGWEPHVLAVEPAGCSQPRDDWLLETLPDALAVTRVAAIPERFTRLAGVGSLTLRAGRALRRAGDALLAGGGFDLVYFSTTQMGVTKLGPRWRERYGVPFVLDLQDPWVNDYYARTGERPPGGRAKYAVASAFAKRDEPRVLRAAAGLTAVSPRYLDDLARRYDWFDPALGTVLPFGGAARDFETVRSAGATQNLYDQNDGNAHWVCVGRGAADMASALRGLFRAFRRARGAAGENSPLRRVRMHFIGTDYAAGSRATMTVAPLAAAEGVADAVEERPHRVPYSVALKCLADADGLLVPGSNDPGYTPSKLYPYLLAKKPTLAILAEGGPAAATAADLLPEPPVTFGPNTSPDALAAAVRTAWVDRWAAGEPPPAASGELGEHSAAAMTRRLAAAFTRAVEPGATP